MLDVNRDREAEVGTAPETRFAKDQLKAIVERIERLEEEKKSLTDDIRDVYAEAKSTGFDVGPKSAPEDSNIRAKGSWHASTTGMVDDRNARNVWTIASAPFDGEFCLACRSYFTGKAKRALRVETTKTDNKEERRRYCTCGCYDRWLSHFATFPVTLAERCIKAGTPPATCNLCGEAKTAQECGGICFGQVRDPGRTLDPFGGAGTVGLVAQRLGFDCTLIELNPDYAEMARCRIDGDASSDYDVTNDLSGSITEGLTHIRQRQAAGGPGWEPK